MENISGFKFQKVIPDKAYNVHINTPGFEYSYGIGDKTVNPLFYVNDEKAQSIGVYEGMNKTALAKKEFPDYTSWYVGLPEYSAGLMKFLLKNTSAHFYGIKDEIFYVGNGMVIMHTAQKGIHKIYFKNGKVTEYNVPEGGATIMFDSESGKVLL